MTYPAVKAAVADEHGVSIASMEQEGSNDPGSDRAPGEARIEFLTHQAIERDLRSTLTSLRDLDAVRTVGSVIPFITPEEGS